MKVEEVGFNGEGLVAKSRAQSDIGDRVESLAVHACTGEIDAVAGHQIVIAAQVDGWHRVFVSVAAPAPGSPCNAEDTSQKPPGHADLALGQERAHLAAGD